MHFHSTTIGIALFAATANAQTELKEKIWGTVVFTTVGQGNPGLSDAELTPLGTRQLIHAGASVRNRYISPLPEGAVEFHQIDGIPPSNFTNGEIDVVVTSDQLTSASAQAFMQGLYPPTSLPRSDNASFPLSNFETLTPANPAVIELAGNVNCPVLNGVRLALLQNEDLDALQDGAEAFYRVLYARVLDGLIKPNKLHLLNARLIWEHLDYQYANNETARNLISAEELLRARYLASRMTSALNSQPFTMADRQYTRAVAGKTLAPAITRALESNVESRGTNKKMSLLFGDVSTMIAFASVAGPPTCKSDSLLRNGTSTADADAGYVPYPLFASKVEIPYDEFISQMGSISMSTTQWCSFCGSEAEFCPPVTDQKDNDNNDDHVNVDQKSYKQDHRRLQALMVVGAIIVFMMVVGGIIALVSYCLGWRKPKVDAGKDPERDVD
ncbi:hypothetical protein CIHG_05646 [Coccidioides immitis H538.4]|uniref:Histidine acid phosphatase n=1 Tax=Coccidioides immitis H538.4 TaxID=396776 RepID=A0A0J8RUX9_COCIT|nr:hypothetical protein CIHG_05646 [Coccidioides immitis H538.4]